MKFNEVKPIEAIVPMSFYTAQYINDKITTPECECDYSTAPEGSVAALHKISANHLRR
jgi:hypothetical protein